MQNRFLTWTVCLLLISLLLSSACVSAADIPPLRLSERAMRDCLHLDVQTHSAEHPLDMITTLAYLADLYDGDLTCYRSRDLQNLQKKILSGKNVLSCVRNADRYRLYRSACLSLLDGLIGDFDLTYQEEQGKSTESRYGLRAYFPLADGYSFCQESDFGAPRAYKTMTHTGHDIVGSIGTPIICMEGGVVEEMGWDTEEGWYVRILSDNGLRRYSYGHLQKDRPFQDLFVGKAVRAGEVIGYLGMTGYSTTVNQNSLPIPRLHLSLELTATNTYVDPYPICALLATRRVPVTIMDQKAKSNQYLISCQ